MSSKVGPCSLDPSSQHIFVDQYDQETLGPAIKPLMWGRSWPPPAAGKELDTACEQREEREGEREREGGREIERERELSSLGFHLYKSIGRAHMVFIRLSVLIGWAL